MRKVISLLLGILMIMSILSGCKNKFDQLAGPKNGETVAEIVVHGYGSIYVKFFPEIAPKAVENFTTHASKGYYDGVKFYRIIEDDRMMGGDPTGTGSGGESIWKEPFKDEFNPDLQPYRGALCMANSGPDMNGSQFFIVQSDQTYNQEVLSQIEDHYQIKFNEKARKLYGEVGGTPWQYRLHTVFGQVYQGFDVLDAIAKVKKKNKESGIPAVDVVIDTIKVFTFQSSK